MKQIAPNIYVEDGYRGVTVGCILTSSGAICIDSPMLPADARDWRGKLSKLSDQPVRFVVLTDANRDRILGVQHLGGTAVAHDAAWEKIKSLGDAFRQQAADSVAPCGADAAAEVAADLRLVLPEITFSKKLIIDDGDMPIVIQHVGGAAPGSVWVHLPERGVLFMGDLATPNTHPLVSEADIATWIDLLEQVQSKEFPARIIVPGRGSPCHKATLRPVTDYLNTMRTRVQWLIRSRKPKVETAQLVAEFLERFPVADQDRDCMQRRIKAGLDHLYDALKSRTSNVKRQT